MKIMKNKMILKKKLRLIKIFLAYYVVLGIEIFFSINVNIVAFVSNAWKNVIINLINRHKRTNIFALYAIIVLKKMIKVVTLK